MLFTMAYGSSSTLAAGISQSELQALDEYPNWVGSSNATQCGAVVGSAKVNGPVVTSQDQTNNAKAVIGIAKADGLSEQGALIGLITAMDESSLTNLANSKVPLSEQNPNKQGDGSNGYSLGIFQQQITDNWSTISSNLNDPNAINQLMTPAYAAEAFFGSPYGSSAPSALTKGLQDVANWQNMQPWVAAQAVQKSGTSDGSNYEHFVSQAQSLLNQLWNSSPPIPLPVPLNSTGAANTSSGCQATCTPTGSAGNSGLSSIRQNIVCLTEQEYLLWKTGQLKPGTNAYFKYSNGRNEEWCADFASWIYDQAGDPLGPGGSVGKPWSVSYVPNLYIPPQDSTKFTYHALGTGYTPQPGDLDLHGSGHVNIVVAVHGSEVTLIGGDQGSTSYTVNSVTEYTTNDPYNDAPPTTGYLSPN
ncbi:MAG TPA: CHAP domain-containing protein [Candidatus Saccharimonadales bacterium]|nr:CHAP domain-containing protein [Candidatus Saccharimonadales bacterium]